MTNKDMINKLKNMAELASASYGYFDLIGKNLDKKDKRIINSSRKDNLKITLYDILDINYKGCEAYQHDSLLKEDTKVGTLNGDFTPLQIQNFFNKYDLLEHQANTYSGFSATLFQDKESKEYIFAIRGTEGFFKGKYCA